MKEDAPRVIKIPAKPEATRQAEARRQLRVAAYCRVSTKEEDQANSYEVQKEYYTDKIMSNTAWTMAGIFADKGITGTSAKKREDFMRMIRHCRQKKIDVILTKSVSRFSRNTVDCLYYIRALKQLGIAVIFEKENINSLEEDSELRITLSGAFAQSESESISANVTWGKRRAIALNVRVWSRYPPSTRVPPSGQWRQRASAPTKVISTASFGKPTRCCVRQRKRSLR